MAGPGWWSDVMAALRSIKKSPGDELSLAADALAKVQQQRQARRDALATAEAERDEAMRRALDGEVDAATLGRHRTAVDQAHSDLAHAEALVRVARERQQHVERNLEVKLQAERMAAFRADVDEATAASREIDAIDRRKVAAVRRYRAATARMRSGASGVGIDPDHFPAIWRPGYGLVNASSLDLVRLAPDCFNYYEVSLANSTPSLLEQHRMAVAAIFPPNPEPRPLAA